MLARLRNIKKSPLVNIKRNSRTPNGVQIEKKEKRNSRTPNDVQIEQKKRKKKFTNAQWRTNRKKEKRNSRTPSGVQIEKKRKTKFTKARGPSTSRQWRIANAPLVAPPQHTFDCVTAKHLNLLLFYL